MLKDIALAKRYIFLETYIYDNDVIGDRFKNLLIKKAKQGVKVKLLVDAWGSSADRNYFKKLIDSGAEFRFFQEFRYVIRIFSKNHERNHRKLLVIDDNITYIGSANITKTCLDWRELVIRLEGDISPLFAEAFLHSWESYDKQASKRIKSLIHRQFEIIRDIPSSTYRVTERRYIQLINQARNKIMIETPYFVPSISIRSALSKAVKRGVKVLIILPYISDIRIMNLVRNRYLGLLYKNGINIYYFMPKGLHSKLLIVDDRIFLLGSSNVDYRSFIHQYEINFIGKNREMILALKNYFNKTLSKSKPFNYEEWRKRSSIKKIHERILFLIREYL